MQFLNLVAKRFSVRHYLEKTVEREKIERCLEAARMAPSACNSQPWHFIVVDQPELMDRVASETQTPLVPVNQFVANAPMIVAVISEKGNLSSRFGSIVKQREFRWIDLGIAVEHFCLQAVEEGLGTCIIGWFNEKPIKALLNVPRDKSIGLLIAVGYPEHDGPKNRLRKPIEAMRSFNSYSTVALK